MKRRPLLLAGLAAFGRPARANGSDAFRLLATASLRDTAGFLSLVAGVNGTRLSFLLDTGADAGLLSPRVADRLVLPRPAGAQATLHGTGGVARTAPLAAIAGLAIGGTLVLRDVPVPLGELPAAPAITPPVVGLLGGDLLRQFAVEIDVAGGTLRLFAPASAGAGPRRDEPPWTGPFSTLPFRWLGNRVVVDARLDGRPVTALLDTGARSRIVSVRAAGVAAETLGGEPGGITSGIDGGERIYHWHRFRTLDIGNERVMAPVLTVAPLSEEVDMLLGADWFATHVVWISYSTGRVFIRPN